MFEGISLKVLIIVYLFHQVHVVAQKLDTINSFQLKPRRTLKGHQSKVLALDWCSDKRHIASTSQVG